MTAPTMERQMRSGTEYSVWMLIAAGIGLVLFIIVLVAYKDFKAAALNAIATVVAP